MSNNLAKRKRAKKHKEPSINTTVYGFQHDGSYECRNDSGNNTGFGITSYEFLVCVTFWLIGKVYFKVKVVTRDKFKGDAVLKAQGNKRLGRFIIWLLSKMQTCLVMTGLTTIVTDNRAGSARFEWTEQVRVRVGDGTWDGHWLTKCIKRSEGIGWSCHAERVNYNNWSDADVY